MQMMNPHEYWQALKSEVNKTVPNITQSEITFKSTSPKIGDMAVEQSVPLLTDAINDIFEVYFGKKRDTVSPALKTSIIKFILDHFYMLTVEDIEFAFKRSQIDYDYKIAFNLKFFVTFIHQWQSVRIKIWQAKKTLVGRQESQTALQIEAKKFETACIEKYRACLKTGEWKGDLHEASLLAKKIVVHLTEDEHNNFKEIARKQHIELSETYEHYAKQKKRNEPTRIGETEVIDVLFATKERLFAKLVVEWGVFNEVEL